MCLTITSHVVPKALINFGEIAQEIKSEILTTLQDHMAFQRLLLSETLHISTFISENLNHVLANRFKMEVTGACLRSFYWTVVSKSVLILLWNLNRKNTEAFYGL